MFRDLAKDYRVKEVNLMNDNYVAYEFKHSKSSKKVTITKYDYNKHPYADVAECRVRVHRNIANKFYYKIVGDGYRLNTTYVA